VFGLASNILLSNVSKQEDKVEFWVSGNQVKLEGSAWSRERGV
jgi:hypothetical protein